MTLNNKWRPYPDEVKKVYEIPNKYPSEENHNSGYREYLDNLEKVNKEHEQRRIQRENVSPYDESVINHVE